MPNRSTCKHNDSTCGCINPDCQIYKDAEESYRHWTKVDFDQMEENTEDDIERNN